MTKNERNNYLMQKADEVLLANNYMFDKKDELSIKESYNGQIAAFGVSVAMSGILPTLAIYYKEKSSTEVNRRDILEVLARMIMDDKEKVSPTIDNAENLFRFAIECSDAERNSLTKELIECAIALKQVVRTYKLVK